MESTFNHIDDLIGKYLAKEATEEESLLVESWMAESEENRKYFDHLKTIFDRAASVTAWHQFDADTAWNKVKGQLHKKPGGKSIPLDREKQGPKLFWRIAASIIVILGAGIFIYRMASETASTTKSLEVVADKKSEADTLPDGSGVYLNKQTKLAYSFNKKKNAHVVKLHGEAYFNIKHEDDKNFIVDVDGILIKDIGTSFNVKGYPESNTIEVVVEEGEVMFYSDNDSGIYLRANGKGTYNKITKKFTIEEPEPNVTAYKTKFFIFSNTDLLTVVQTLNEVYDQKITINNSLHACRLTVTFNDENIDEIVNVIAETLGLTIKRSGQQILLEGKACGD